MTHIPVAHTQPDHYQPPVAYPTPPAAHESHYSGPMLHPYMQPPPNSYNSPFSSMAPPGNAPGRYIPYAPGQPTPIHSINDHVEPDSVSGQLPPDYWQTMSCTVNIDSCPAYCCHVRATQESAEGRTDWKMPYGPPLMGTVRCSCCVNQ